MQNNPDFLYVNKFLPFSIVDGPGNRIAIFTQTCNVGCVYCHNPETIAPCIHCKKCVPVCPTGALTVVNGLVTYNMGICIDCDACVEICETSSSPKTIFYSIDEMLKKIEKYKVFARGITISGGEATLQKEFLTKLFPRVKEMGLTCFVDTNGFTNTEDMKELIEVTDKFMVDIKTVSHFEKLLGVKVNENVLENLETLLKMDKVYEVRTVIIEDFIEVEKTVIETSKAIKGYDVIYKLIRVRNHGVRDSEREGVNTNIPSLNRMEELKKLAIEYGAKTVEII
mgnify:CR=1 FL=1